MSNKEIWKDVVGYEGLYKVSNLGRVRSLDKEIIITGVQKHPVKGIKKGKIKGQYLNRVGYAMTVLVKNEKRKYVLIHRLVAKAFIPNPENKPQVDHINGVKSDNRVENLRWATAKENKNNEVTKKLLKGKKHTEETKAKIKEKLKGKNIGNQGKKIKCLNTGEIFISAGEAGRNLNVDISGIIKCCKGKKESAKGYKFEYYKE